MLENKNKSNSIQQVDVSVVIPCYKCGKTIERAVRSIWEQTYLPKEVILIEDCSDDEDQTRLKLVDLIESYPKGWIKTVFLQNNSGPGNARNIGWDKAIGEYIAFLDADDTWHKKKIEIQYEVMKTNTQLSLCGHQSEVYTEPANLEYTQLNPIIKRVRLQDMFISNRFLTRTVMLKRAIPIRFDSEMYRAEDFLLWCRILASGYAGGVFDAKLSFTHDSDAETLTSNLKATEVGELLAYKKMLQDNIISRPRYAICSVFSYCKYIVRKAKVRI